MNKNNLIFILIYLVCVFIIGNQADELIDKIELFSILTSIFAILLLINYFINEKESSEN